MRQGPGPCGHSEGRLCASVMWRPVCPCVSRVSRVACVSRLPPVSFLIIDYRAGILRSPELVLVYRYLVAAGGRPPCVCNSNLISTTVIDYCIGLL